MISFFSRLKVAIALSAVVGIVGCGAPEAQFRLNWAQIRSQEVALDTDISPEQRESIQEVLEAMFGTPDEPKIPELADLDTTSIMDPRKLEMSSGPVKRDNVQSVSGLYREHCAHCHGVTGDGAGPTATFLNPYPRDYRRGLFKFKSTPRTIPPTDDDLHRTLYEGIPGTSMPSFKLLPLNELESLAHYVRYLSIRG